MLHMRLLPCWTVLITLLFGFKYSVSAQLVNGQFYTAGLAISNAPAPGSQLQAGGAIGVSVDVSGNGRLPPGAATAGSSLPTAFISLNIFLISSETSTNITVTSGPQFLEGEPGSTVKHLNYAIPNCLKTGNYNYTYYEVSRINGQTFFSITPIPIFILNNQSPSGNDPCAAAVPPESQPQPSSPPPEQPFLGPGFSLTTGFSQPAAPTNTGTQETVTVTLTTTIVSTVATSITTTRTVTLSDGEIETTTLVVPTSFPTTVTTVFTTASAGLFNPINATGRTIHIPFLLWTFTSGLLLSIVFWMS